PLLPALRRDEWFGHGVEPCVDRMPPRRELDPPADDRQHRERADGYGHRRPHDVPLERIEVLAHEGARLAPEHDEDEPERVDAGEGRTREADRPEDVAV